MKSSEYEYVAYPKMNHVKIGFVEIRLRNPHVHRESEIGLVLSGTARMTVDAHSFVLGPGSLYYINGNEPHDVISEGVGGVRIAFLQLSNHFCRDYLHLFRNLDIEWRDLSRHLAPADCLELTRLLLDVFRSYTESGELCQLHIMTSVCRLFSRLLETVPFRLIDEAAYRAKKRRTARLQRITEYVSSHYTEKISLSALAEAEGLSPTYLSHFIHDSLNMTFQEYVNDLRLEKALHLITGTDLRLTDVYLECGFSDIKYLNQSFKKRFGCHPKEYRAAVTRDSVRTPGAGEMQEFASEKVGQGWLKEFTEEFEKKDPKR
jgi:AraC-like DNA-binding protein